MNILMLTSSFPRYEGDFCGPWILEYCRELVSQGHTVTVLSPAISGFDRAELSVDGMRVCRFDYWHDKDKQYLAHPPGMVPQLAADRRRYVQLIPFLVSFYRHARALIRAERFDIIHSQWVIPAGFIGSLLSRRTRIPHVITSQGAEFFLSPKHPFSWFTRYTLRHTDALLPVSEQMARRSSAYGSVPDRIRVVPNSVNTDVFEPGVPNDFRASLGLSEETHIVLTVRRLVHEKRVQDVIEAFSSVRDRDVCLVIGGDGPERRALEELVASKGMKDVVRFVGFLDNQDLPPVYAAADTYVLSSEQEGLSLSLLEAMSSGLVVVSTNTTGGDEAIVPSESGFLFSTGDTSELSGILRHILSLSAEARTHIGENARRTVLDNYSVTRMVNAWSDIYQRLLEERPNRAPATRASQEAHRSGNRSRKH